ncbi:MAG: hypothetical protein MI861_16455, partial [Pirellulales bacterium]|nr:hypothetical protein [Pirellulales bacterium]
MRFFNAQPGVLSSRAISVFFALVAASTAVGPLASAQQPGRVGQGLLLLYDFNETDGDLIRDQAGGRAPVHLRIQNPEAVKRTAGALQVTGKTLIQSDQPPRQLIQAVKRRGEITIEAWISPQNVTQQGPARILTLSRDGSERNFTLGQEESKFDIRLRTTKTSTNGIPSTSSPNNSLQN